MKSKKNTTRNTHTAQLLIALAFAVVSILILAMVVKQMRVSNTQTLESRASAYELLTPGDDGLSMERDLDTMKSDVMDVFNEFK